MLENEFNLDFFEKVGIELENFKVNRYTGALHEDTEYAMMDLINKKSKKKQLEIIDNITKYLNNHKYVNESELVAQKLRTNKKPLNKVAYEVAKMLKLEFEAMKASTKKEKRRIIANYAKTIYQLFECKDDGVYLSMHTVLCNRINFGHYTPVYFDIKTEKDNWNKDFNLENFSKTFATVMVGDEWIENAMKETYSNKSC